MSLLTQPSIARSKAQNASIGLLLLVLLAFALRIIALDRLGLDYDEAASAIMARATPPEIIAFHWRAAFEHPPFWVLLLHAWSHLAGQSEFALRIIPAFAGTLIVVMVWKLVIVIWPDDDQLPLLSALLVAVAPVMLFYSQEARMYTLVVLLLLISTYLMLRLCVRPSWTLVIAFWLVCWGMLGLHYYSGLGLAIQAAVLLIVALISGNVRHLPWGKLFAAYIGAALPLAGWMLFSPGFHTTLNVVLDKAGENPPSWQTFLKDLWRELSFGNIRWQPDYAVWGYLVAPFVVLGGLLMLVRPRQSAMTRIGVWLIIALVVLPVLSGTIALRTLAPRYILWVVPLFYIMAAYPAALLWRRHWLMGLVALLVIIAIDLLALQNYLGPYRKSDYREMTTYLQKRGDLQHEILILEAPRQHLLTQYYLPAQWEVHPMPTLPIPAYWPVTAPLLVPEDEDDRILAWFTQRDGLWVSYTSEAEVDKSEFLAKYLTAVAYREECSQWLDVRLCHYLSPRHVAATAIAMTPVLFNNELAVAGAHSAFYHPASNTTVLLVQLDWFAQQKPTANYKFSMRLLGADGSTLVEANDYPIGDLLPPTTWNSGDHKPGYVALKIPSNLPAGHYPIVLSLYDAKTLTASAHTPLSNPPSTDAPTTEPLTLAELQVDDTMQLLSPVGQ